MRIIQPGPLILQETSLQGLKFQGNHQETIQISVLEEDIIRVQHFPLSLSLTPKTRDFEREK